MLRALTMASSTHCISTRQRSSRCLTLRCFVPSTSPLQVHAVCYIAAAALHSTSMGFDHHEEMLVPCIGQGGNTYTFCSHVVIISLDFDAGLEPKVKNMTTYEYTVANTSSWNCAAQIVNRTAELQLATNAGRNITFDT